MNLAPTEAPHFDDLEIGQVFDNAPAITLTEGKSALHQSITGSRLQLPLDQRLSHSVLRGTIADPALVWDIAIGQSTVVTQRVIANLFYRGLAFHRTPLIGDSLHTRTEVVALRQNRSKPTGLAALRITTTDQHDRVVLDFWRCAMLPLRDPAARTGHHADLSTIGAPPDLTAIAATISSWDLAELSGDGPDITPGRTWTVTGGDVVSSAPELARLTLNIATVHHDAYAQQHGRLVYGGHTIGLALAQLSRTLPHLVTIAGWHGCDHTGPVREGDTLTSSIHVDNVEPLPGTAKLAHLRVHVRARSDNGEQDVLDWRPIAVFATKTLND